MDLSLQIVKMQFFSGALRERLYFKSCTLHKYSIFADDDKCAVI